MTCTRLYTPYCTHNVWPQPSPAYTYISPLPRPSPPQLRCVASTKPDLSTRQGILDSLLTYPFVEVLCDYLLAIGARHERFRGHGLYTLARAYRAGEREAWEFKYTIKIMYEADEAFVSFCRLPTDPGPGLRMKNTAYVDPHTADAASGALVFSRTLFEAFELAEQGQWELIARAWACMLQWSGLEKL